jgi:hypothetical protein
LARRHYIRDVAQSLKFVKGLDRVDPIPREGWRKNMSRQGLDKSEGETFKD